MPTQLSPSGFRPSTLNPFEINKSLVVARLLSGRYRTDWLSRHWSKDNKLGHCLLCPGKNLPGTVEHLLSTCEGLSDKRQDLLLFWNQQTQENEHLGLLISNMLSSPAFNFIQFVLDPSAVPQVIEGCQQKLFALDEVFALTRTFCYGLHRRRLQLIGRFDISM